MKEWYFSRSPGSVTADWYWEMEPRMSHSHDLRRKDSRRPAVHGGGDYSVHEYETGDCQWHHPATRSLSKKAMRLLRADGD